MKRPLFSICIPNYNYARYLGKTIESVLSQTFDDYEIIVADNCSTDSSVEVVRAFESSKIRLYRNRYNVGFAPNLDKAAGRARGHYLILLSSDDLMLPKALNTYASIIGGYNGFKQELVIMSGCDVIDAAGNHIGEKAAATGDVVQWLAKHVTEPNGKRKVEVYDGHFILKGLLTGSFQPAGQFLTTCFSRRLYQRVEGYRSVTSISPDAHFSHKLCFQDPKLIYVNRTLFQYRIHRASNFSQAQKMANIRLLVDKYLFTQMYSVDELNQIGLKPEDLRQAFVKHWCLKVPFYALLRGLTSKAFRHVMFGLAAYPSAMFANLRTYLIFVLLGASPVLGWLYRVYQARCRSLGSKERTVARHEVAIEITTRSRASMKKLPRQAN